MPNYITAGVFTTEFDISQIVPSLSTTTAALVGGSAMGPVAVNLVTSQNQFLAQYGQPNPSNPFHYTAMAFLAQGNQLYCRRAVHSDCLYGGVCVNKTAISPVAVGISPGITDPTAIPSGYTNAAFFVFGVNPGAWDNNISIEVVASANPGASDPTSIGWFDIQVYYTSNGVTVLKETWTVSRTKQLDGFGNQMYLETKINGFSNYILVKDNTVLAAATIPAYGVAPIAMTDGADGTAVLPGTEDADVAAAWGDFSNPNTVDIRILINGGFASTTVANAMMAVIVARKFDCMMILDIPSVANASSSAMVSYRNTLSLTNPSYAALYGPWVKIYDQYNDTVVSLPASGFVGAVYAYNDYVGQPWTAPAGFTRGILPVQSAALILSPGDSDLLVSNQINPIQYFKGQGIIVWDQATLQVKSSALSLVNVRRLLITLEKAISVTLPPFLFEPNDANLWLRISSIITEYMDRLSAQRAFSASGNNKGYSVVCNGTNNPPASVDAGIVNVTIGISPIRPAKYIQLNVVITQTGVSFQELLANGSLGV